MNKIKLLVTVALISSIVFSSAGVAQATECNSTGVYPPGCIAVSGEVTESVVFTSNSSVLSSASKAKILALAAKVPNNAANVKVSYYGRYWKGSSFSKKLSVLRPKSAISFLKKTLIDATYKELSAKPVSRVSAAARTVFIKISWK